MTALSDAEIAHLLQQGTLQGDRIVLDSDSCIRHTDRQVTVELVGFLKQGAQTAVFETSRPDIVAKLSPYQDDQVLIQLRVDQTVDTDHEAGSLLGNLDLFRFELHGQPFVCHLQPKLQETLEDTWSLPSTRGVNSHPLSAVEPLIAIAKALSVLHEKLAIVHADVSASNILVGADGILRLGDFGASVSLPSAKRLQVDISTVPFNRPPELSQEISLNRLTFEISPAFDVYMFGTLLVSCIERRSIPDDSLRSSLKNASIDDQLARLIESMIREAPDRRPSMQQVVRQLGLWVDAVRKRHNREQERRQRRRDAEAAAEQRLARFIASQNAAAVWIADVLTATGKDRRPTGWRKRQWSVLAKEAAVSVVIGALAIGVVLVVQRPQGGAPLGPFNPPSPGWLQANATTPFSVEAQTSSVVSVDARPVYVGQALTFGTSAIPSSRAGMWDSKGNFQEFPTNTSSDTSRVIAATVSNGNDLVAVGTIKTGSSLFGALWTSTSLSAPQLTYTASLPTDTTSQNQPKVSPDDVPTAVASNGTVTAILFGSGKVAIEESATGMWSVTQSPPDSSSSYADIAITQDGIIWIAGCESCGNPNQTVVIASAQARDGQFRPVSNDIITSGTPLIVTLKVLNGELWLAGQVDQHPELWSSSDGTKWNAVALPVSYYTDGNSNAAAGDITVSPTGKLLAIGTVDGYTRTQMWSKSPEEAAWTLLALPSVATAKVSDRSNDLFVVGQQLYIVARITFMDKVRLDPSVILTAVFGSSPDDWSSITLSAATGARALGVENNDLYGYYIDGAASPDGKFVVAWGTINRLSGTALSRASTLAYGTASLDDISNDAPPPLDGEAIQAATITNSGTVVVASRSEGTLTSSHLWVKSSGEWAQASTAPFTSGGGGKTYNVVWMGVVAGKMTAVTQFDPAPDNSTDFHRGIEVFQADNPLGTWTSVGVINAGGQATSASNADEKLASGACADSDGDVVVVGSSKSGATVWKAHNGELTEVSVTLGDGVPQAQSWSSCAVQSGRLLLTGSVDSNTQKVQGSNQNAGRFAVVSGAGEGLTQQPFQLLDLLTSSQDPTTFPTEGCFSDNGGVYLGGDETGTAGYNGGYDGRVWSGSGDSGRLQPLVSSDGSGPFSAPTRSDPSIHSSYVNSVACGQGTVVAFGSVDGLPVIAGFIH